MEDKKFDMISIGDSTIDVFMEIEDFKVENGFLMLESAAKIGVKKKTRIAAVGNSANQAIGSSRLGLHTAIYTHIGGDSDGRDMMEVFKSENVVTAFIRVDRDKNSNFSTVVNYGAERVIFVFHEHRDYNLPDLPESRWAYYSSSSAGHDILHSQIPDYVRKYNVKLGYNPGTFQLKEGLDGEQKIYEVCEVLILNREEAQHLVGGDKSETKRLLDTLHAKGPKKVIITDARAGAFAFDGNEYLHCGIPENSPVVERTGCGDAFSTGSLAALSKDLPLREALVWGTLNSTSVIQYIGAREGLLTPQGLDKIRQEWGKDFEVVNF